MRRSYRFKGDVNPARYLSGLDKELRQKRDQEITRRKRIAKDDPDNPILDTPLPGDKGAKTKVSKYTKAFKEKYGDLDGGLDGVAKATSISKKHIETIYARGVQASKSAGHRPGVSHEQWGWARVYAFVMKHLHGMDELNHDKDIAKKI